MKKLISFGVTEGSSADVSVYLSRGRYALRVVNASSTSGSDMTVTMNENIGPPGIVYPATLITTLLTGPPVDGRTPFECDDCVLSVSAQAPGSEVASGIVWLLEF